MSDTQATTWPCPYCQNGIHPEATRCVHCGGEGRYCKRCKKAQGMTIKQKFVGIARGGTKTQFRCMGCGAVLDGPRS